ncbi:MAG: DUF3592 domain-containing protein [Acidobacteria bacterium]|nr:DUF3592 domain-containing protein [Acidobacteriota bacterium]
MPVALLAGVVGLVTLAGGLAACVAAVRRRRCERRAALTHTGVTGRVVERYVPPGSSTYANGPRYTIEFAGPEGNPLRFTTDSVGWQPKHVGDTVDVLYDPRHPEQAIVRGGERIAAILFAIAGVVFTLVGLLFALAAIHAHGHQAPGTVLRDVGAVPVSSAVATSLSLESPSLNRLA